MYSWLAICVASTVLIIVMSQYRLTKRGERVACFLAAVSFGSFIAFGLSYSMEGVL